MFTLDGERRVVRKERREDVRDVRSGEEGEDDGEVGEGERELSSPVDC